MSQSFQPLLFGGDINVYSVARAFHEAYGVRSVAFGKYPSFPCRGSAILDYRVCPDNEADDAFLTNVRQVAGEFAGSTVLLLGCGDSYVRLAARYRDRLPGNVIAPYISEDLLLSLTDKEQFYALCDARGIDHPATYIYRPEMGHDFSLPWDFPCIAKPADSVAYWACGDASLAKVYLCATREELLRALDSVYAAGYPGHMILQEFIPGDDSYMRVLTGYSDRNGRVTTLCLGHVLLEEHTLHGRGNHAVILTECQEDLELQLRSLLESLHYVGFFNFDIKYDRRDGKYRVFELNCRQGRSNYYVTGAGHNIARLVVEDRLEHADLPFCMTREESLWRMVPLRVAYRYTPKKYHDRMRRLVQAGADHHSLIYSGDASLKRRMRVARFSLGCLKRFHETCPEPEN